MKKLQLTAIAAVTAALFAGSALAADEYSYSGFYVGFGVGSANTQMKQHSDYYTAATNTIAHYSDKMSGTDFGYNFYLGYNINDWFAVETGYLSANSVKIDDYNDNMYMHAFTITPKFTYHFDKVLSVYAKGGIAFTNAKIDINNGFDGSVSDNHAGYTYGVGFEAAVTNNVTLRLSYDAVQSDLGAFAQTYRYINGDYQSDGKVNAHLDYFSFNAQYNF